MVLWSDSCVPQNRNKVVTTVIKIFMQNHKSKYTITHKSCEPGYSEIQEIAMYVTIWRIWWLMYKSTVQLVRNEK